MLTEEVLLFAVFSIMVAGHYFPWEQIPSLRKHGGLPPAAAHAYGVVWIWSGFVVWLLQQPSESVALREAARFLTLVVVSAGAGAIIPRLIAKLLREAIMDELIETERRETERRREP